MGMAPLRMKEFQEQRMAKNTHQRIKERKGETGFRIN
jgi:hypothetical protein